MVDQRHVYAVIVTSWSDGGPLLGLYDDAWDAIQTLRSRYPGKLWETPVPDPALAEGVVFNAEVMGMADTHVKVERRAVVPAS